MHSTHPTPNSNITSMHCILRKTFISKSISEQQIWGQFVANSTQRRNHSSTALVNIPYPVYTFQSLIEWSPLWSNPGLHWTVATTLTNISVRAPKGLHHCLTPRALPLRPRHLLISETDDKHAPSLSACAQGLQPLPIWGGFPTLLRCFHFT